jgi:hypothetical protein
MKQRYALLPVSALFTLCTGAQQVQWLNAAPVAWMLSYEMPGHLIHASRNGHVSVTRQFGSGMSYGVDVFNSVMVEHIDPATGFPMGGCPMTDSVLVESMAVGDDGTTYVAGRFMGAIQFCDGTTLGGSPGFLDTDLFIAAFAGENFAPLWARNLSLTHPDGQRVPALEIDVTGNVWYGLEEFDVLRVISLDAQGNDVEERTIHGTRTLGGFSFDPSNNLFVSGSTGQSEGPLVFGGLSVPVNEAYMMFVLHFNGNGTGDWARLAHDVTFSSPDVVAGGYGEAFISGLVMDSLSWGDVHLHGPNWISDVFLVRVDATGEFDWGIESAPAGGPINGDMMRSKGPSLASDGSANVYLTGTVRGQVDWGNGIISDALTMGAQAQTIVAFANNGTPLWQKTSDPGALNAQNVSCDEEGNVFISAHTDGNYAFTPNSVNIDGAQAFADARIDASTTAILPVQSNTGTIVWPVPASTSLSVDNPEQRSACRLISTTGSTVFRSILPRGLSTIDLSTFATGVYTLRFDDGRAVRVVKE